MRPLRTTIASAFSSGSSITSQRPTLRNSTATPAHAMSRKMANTQNALDRDGRGGSASDNAGAVNGSSESKAKPDGSVRVRKWSIERPEVRLIHPSSEVRLRSILRLQDFRRIDAGSHYGRRRLFGFAPLRSVYRRGLGSVIARQPDYGSGSESRSPGKESKISKQDRRCLRADFGRWSRRLRSAFRFARQSL